MDKIICEDCGCELNEYNTSYEYHRCDDCVEEAKQDEDYEDEE